MSVERIVSKNGTFFTFKKQDGIWLAPIDAFFAVFSSSKVSATFERPATRSFKKQQLRQEQKQLHEQPQQKKTFAEAVRTTIPPASTVSEPQHATTRKTPSVAEEQPLKHYTNEDRIRAKSVLALHKALGHPSDKRLAQILQTGEIKDCHLAPRDIKVARDLYGECNDCLRGKMRAPNVPSQSTSPPADNIGSHWSADFFFVKRKGGHTRPILLLTEEKTGLDVAYVMKTRSAHEVLRVGKQFQTFLKNFGIKWAEVTQSAPDQHAKGLKRKWIR